MSGYASKVGYYHVGSWATAFSQANVLVPLAAQSGSRNFVELGSEALLGTAAMRDRQDGTELVKTEVAAELDYNNLGLLRYGMGSVSGGTYDLVDDLSAAVCHIEADLGGSKRLRYNNAMVDKMSLAGEFNGKPLRLTSSCIAKGRVESDVAFPSLSLTTPQRVYMEHIRDASGMFRIGDLTDALAAGDAVPITGFEFAVEHGLKAEDVDTSSAYVLQPLRGDWRKVTFKIKLNRMTATTLAFLGWKASGTRLQAQLALAKSGESVTLYLPNLKIVDGGEWPIEGPGPLSSEVTFQAYYNGPSGSRINGNTGFAFDNEARIVVV